MTSRNPDGEFQHDLEQAELDATAARHRANGLTYPQIATEMGCSLSTAHGRVQRALAAVPAESVQMLRAIEGDRLDAMRRRLLTIALETHYHPRRLWRGVEVGEKVIDRGPNIAALRELRLVSESTRKLFGADVPGELRVRVSDDITDEIERLVQELELNDAEAAEVEA